jgi:hypothetical protein
VACLILLVGFMIGCCAADGGEDRHNSFSFGASGLAKRRGLCLLEGFHVLASGRGNIACLR